MAREELFDLAVNRALAYARGTRALERAADDAALQRELELWVLRTRFAYRVDLGEVARRVRQAPRGDVHWAGGPSGAWNEGASPGP